MRRLKMKYRDVDYFIARDYLSKKIGTGFKAAIILGTGLNALEDIFCIEAIIPYQDIPGFHSSTAPSHNGNLMVGKIQNERFVILSGRLHYYEGYSAEEIVFPIRVLKLLGIDRLVITNGTGGLNTEWNEGDYMIIKDHLYFHLDSPCRGANLAFLGERFFDISKVYAKEYINLLKSIAYEQNIVLREGIYSYMPGPQFESEAEVKVLRMYGADCVGMSTVHESIAAAHCGMKVAAISHIANFTAGLCEGEVECGVVENDKTPLLRLLKEFLIRCE